jgi:sodium/potassium-transporting ATPase subunit alpha
MYAGSDVAKDAAAIVLLKDDFTSIVECVREGRLIFANLRKAVGYQISAGAWSELLPVLATFFLGMAQPLSSFLMIIISCMTDVFAGIALTREPSEKTIMLDQPRDLKMQPLVDIRLILYSYLFYGTLQSVGAFYMYFIYMAERGPTRAVPSPVPADDDGFRTFPAGYRSSQLINAWNWGSASSDSPLGIDEANASNVASSVFFVTLVVAQWGHLISIRRKTPYFSDSILRRAYTTSSTSNQPDHTSIWMRMWRELLDCPPRPPVVAAIICSGATAVFFTEVPIVQVSCGTGSVAPRYWGMAIGWSLLWFVVAEIRKWIILLFPDSWFVRLIRW